MSKITNDGLTQSRTMMLHINHICTHMATVGVKGLLSPSHTVTQN